MKTKVLSICFVLSALVNCSTQKEKSEVSGRDQVTDVKVTLDRFLWFPGTVLVTCVGKLPNTYSDNEYAEAVKKGTICPKTEAYFHSVVEACLENSLDESGKPADLSDIKKVKLKDAALTLCKNSGSSGCKVVAASNECLIADESPYKNLYMEPNGRENCWSTPEAKRHSCRYQIGVTGTTPHSNNLGYSITVKR